MQEIKPYIIGEIGSYAHGLNNAQSDHDYIGVYADPPEVIIGLKSAKDAIRDRDKPEGVKSTAGDSETTYYPLRQYVYQVVKGNPTMMTLLFTPTLTMPDTIGLQANRELFLSRIIATTHVGYAESMAARIKGEKAPRTNRPELIEAHGFDTKACFHAIRLLIQGHEMLTRQTMTMPMHDLAREFLLGVRNGEYSQARCLEEIEFWRDRIAEAGETSKLPEKPDMAKVNTYLVDTHRQMWAWDTVPV
ncbi:DNA polymerase beta superfamily protein [Mycolicibacterium sphagni]|uniref:Nucleotidyltransferase n=1 Tax=Mycolicibacterium sphagni TaxID=1786 RepID=A0A255DQS0_9MYCO|nr:nucleotidyltransferase domain-containing protein [Mycolicibacterium sphagni]OYN81797.1 hypothetical protein CG716_05500 [Mycolicibacterium sphagni]